MARTTTFHKEKQNFVNIRFSQSYKSVVSLVTAPSVIYYTEISCESVALSSRKLIVFLLANSEYFKKGEMHPWIFVRNLLIIREGGILVPESTFL